MSFNSNDSINTNDIYNINSAGDVTSTLGTVLSYNSNGSVNTITQYNDNPDGSFTGYSNVTSLAYNDDGTVQSQGTAYYYDSSPNVSPTQYASAATDYTYANGLPATATETTTSDGLTTDSQLISYDSQGNWTQDGQALYTDGQQTGLVDTTFNYNPNQTVSASDNLDYSVASHVATGPIEGKGESYNSNGSEADSYTTTFNASGQPFSWDETGYDDGSAYQAGYATWSYPGNGISTATGVNLNPDGSIADTYQTNFGSNNQATGGSQTDYSDGTATGTWEFGPGTYNQNGDLTAYTSTEYQNKSEIGYGNVQIGYDSYGDETAFNESAYSPQNVEQWSESSSPSSFGSENLGFETYTATGQPYSMEDFAATYGSPLTPVGSTDWQYDPGTNAEVGYYNQSYAYDGNSYPASTYQEDYNSAGQMVTSLDSYYNSQGYLATEDLGMYGVSGSYEGSAYTSLSYGAGESVLGQETDYYSPDYLASGYQQQYNNTGSSGSLSASIEDYGATGDLYASALASYGGDDGLEGYTYDDGGSSYVASFGSDGDPDASSGDWVDPTSYDDGYGDGGDDARGGGASNFSNPGMAGGVATPFGQTPTSTDGTTDYYSSTQPTASETSAPTAGETGSATPVSVTTPSSTIPTVDLSTTGTAFQMDQGQLFIARLGDFQAAAAGAVTDYTAIINWGDGSMSEGVESAVSGGGFAIVGTHSYASDGEYQITAAVTDLQGQEVTDFATVAVTPPAPTVTGVSPTVGPAAGGTAVTITGTGFSGATAVDFGTSAATTVVVNSAGTQITATDPAGSGLVNVMVTTAGGTSATSPADQFSYVAAPVVTGVTPAVGPAAGGTTVTITGTRFNGATAVDFGTSAATNVVVNSPGTQITATDPAGSGVVNVTVTTPGGASATSSADEFGYVGPLTVPATDWASAGLTLTLDSDGNLHAYITGTTTDVVPTSPLANVTSVEVTAPNNTTADLTIDSTRGDPIPAGGLNYSGAGGLVKTGTGSIGLSGANTYMGGTTVLEGTLVATNPAALPGGTSLTIGAGGTFIFDPTLAASSATKLVSASDSSSAESQASSDQPPASKVPAGKVPAIIRPNGVLQYVVAPRDRRSSASAVLRSFAGPAHEDTLEASAHAAVLYQIGREGINATVSPHYAADLAWLAASGSIGDSSDQNQKKDHSIHALDAVLAEYSPIPSSINR